MGTLAITRAPKATATKGKITSNVKNTVTTPRLKSGSQDPLVVTVPAWDEVFEIEGNAVDDSGPGLPDDWNDLNPGNISVNDSTSVTGAFGNAQIATFVSDPAISTDLIYTGGGSKDFNEISDWGQVAKGTGPPKDDVEHAYAAKYVTSGNHSILVFGGDRLTNNGDANIGFWFFQNAVGPNDSGGFSGLHKNGDVFILSAFSGGGGSSTIRALVWVGEPDTAGPGGTDSGALARCNAFGAGSVIDPKSDTTAFPQGSLCDITGSHPNSGTGVTNGPLGTSISISWQYKNTDSTQGGKAPAGTGVTCTSAPCNIPSPDFFEGVIDLTDLGLAGECFSSFLLETRSSAEVSAVLKDFALGNFNTCACSVTPLSASVCAGSTTQFCAVNPLGAPGPFTYKWDGIDDTAHTQQCLTTGDAGTHKVVITDANGNVTMCEGTLTVNPSPSITVVVDTSCADSITLTASATGGTAPFQFNWDGAGFSTTATKGVSIGPSTHTVEVKNAEGCTSSKTVHIGLCCRDCDPTP